MINSFTTLSVSLYYLKSMSLCPYTRLISTICGPVDPAVTVRAGPGFAGGKKVIADYVLYMAGVMVKS